MTLTTDRWWHFNCSAAWSPNDKHPGESEKKHQTSCWRLGCYRDTLSDQDWGPFTAHECLDQLGPSELNPLLSLRAFPSSVSSLLSITGFIVEVSSLQTEEPFIPLAALMLKHHIGLPNVCDLCSWRSNVFRFGQDTVKFTHSNYLKKKKEKWPLLEGHKKGILTFNHGQFNTSWNDRRP